jgi:hypothetical protein
MDLGRGFVDMLAHVETIVTGGVVLGVAAEKQVVHLNMVGLRIGLQRA